MLNYSLHGADHDSTVVLLHSLALDGSIWSDVVSSLATHSEVITPDLTGHGKSPRATPEMTIESMADDVAELIGSLGRAPATVIGMSLGGSVAQALAIGHPECVSTLGLVDTTAWYGPSALADWTERADRADANGLASLSAFQVDRWFSAPFVAKEPAVCQRLLEIFVANDPASYRATCLALGRMDLRDRLAGIHQPTAIVVGENDEATPIRDAEDLAKRIAGAQLRVIPDGKHLTGIERPAAVLEGLSAILPN